MSPAPGATVNSTLYPAPGPSRTLPRAVACSRTGTANGTSPGRSDRRPAPASHRLELREGAHDLLPRIVEARLEVLDLRIAPDQPQLEARDPLLEDRIAGWRAARWRRPAGDAVFGHLGRQGRRVERTRSERRA